MVNHTSFGALCSSDWLMGSWLVDCKPSKDCSSIGRVVLVVVSEIATPKNLFPASALLSAAVVGACVLPVLVVVLVVGWLLVLVDCKPSEVVRRNVRLTTP